MLPLDDTPALLPWSREGAVVTVADSCAELALLAPMLAPALQRDNAGGSRVTRWECTLSPVNTDVLSVMITLRHEIPAAAMRCCELTHEPWQARDLRVYLLALPRWHDRLHVLNVATGGRWRKDGREISCCHLEDAVALWVRITKRALGLRTPDIPLHAWCPRCPADPAGELLLAGSEAFVDPRDLTAPPRWEHNPLVYCTLSPEPPERPHMWGMAEWGLLERLIGQARAEQQQVSA